MLKPEQVCPGFRGFVEDQDRLTAAVGQRLDITPAHPAYARAERLHRRFFGGEPGRQLCWPGPVSLAFSRCEYTIEEALAMTIENGGYPGNLDDVNAYFDWSGGFRIPERFI
jgi:hypothetical protein